MGMVQINRKEGEPILIHRERLESLLDQTVCRQIELRDARAFLTFGLILIGFNLLTMVSISNKPWVQSIIVILGAVSVLYWCREKRRIDRKYRSSWEKWKERSREK